jgi:hypothetical protein
MVSPVREKRAWPPQDRDADGETVAAFEAAVAVVKETVVRSGEVLVSAKEDLSDHQRWLKAQSVAVQEDRERHERWLQRQRERQEALERREQKRVKRRAARQASIRSIKDAIAAAGLAVRSAVWSVIARVLAGLNSLARTAASGLAWVFGQFRQAGIYVGGMARARLHALAPSIVPSIGIGFGGLAARTKEASRLLGRWLNAAFSWLSTKFAIAAHVAGQTLAPAVGGITAKGYALMPSFWHRLATAGLAAKTHAKEAAENVLGLLPRFKTSRARAENTLSLPLRVRGVELSQMLIIAGAVLLVCGALMLGSGLVLRASTATSSSPIAAEAEPEEPIAWLFEHKTIPIDERSIFIYEATPSGVRIKGFSIGAVNMSEGPVVVTGGVIKPDLHEEDLKLDLVVERPSGGEGEAEAAGAASSETIAPQESFKLVFLFPAAEAPEDVLKSAGGVLLKVRYEAAGKQRSFIQYLPPLLLEEQLAEIKAETKGSS